MSILRCDNLTVAYENKTAVKNVSFEIDAGDYLCIIGQNGTGKSTLLKALLGLCHIKEGKVILDGITQKDIGYLAQKDSVLQGFPATVFETVLSGKKSLFYGKKDRRQADQALKMLDIEDLKKRNLEELSGGQRRRVFLARALCAQSKLILFDEPSSALDTQATAELYSLLRKLNREFGITIIMISHDLENVIHDANKVLRLDTSLVYFGTVDGYRKNITGGNNIEHI